MAASHLASVDANGVALEAGAAHDIHHKQALAFFVSGREHDSYLGHDGSFLLMSSFGKPIVVSASGGEKTFPTVGNADGVSAHLLAFASQTGEFDGSIVRGSARSDSLALVTLWCMPTSFCSICYS